MISLMASLVLTDSSQLTALKSYQTKLCIPTPDQMICKNMCLAAVTSDSQHLEVIEEEDDNNDIQPLPVAECLPERLHTDLYLNNLAELFLKLEAEFMVPSSTIQHLVQQLHNIEIQDGAIINNEEEEFDYIGEDQQMNADIVATEEDFNDNMSTYSESSESSDGDESSSENSEEEAIENLYFCGTYQKRTVEKYQEALTHIDVGKNYQGLKFNSVFNGLNYYHVCMPGLCPCCGHDLLEGVVAVDVPLFIKYFVGKGWFTYSDLNNRIETFKYSPSDRKDKPVKLADKSNMPLFTVVSSNRKDKVLVSGDTIDKVIATACKKLGLSSQQCKIVLDQNGALIDEDEFLSSLPILTEMMILTADEEWVSKEESRSWREEKHCTTMEARDLRKILGMHMIGTLRDYKRSTVSTLLKIFGNKYPQALKIVDADGELLNDGIEASIIRLYDHINYKKPSSEKRKKTRPSHSEDISENENNPRIHIDGRVYDEYGCVAYEVPLPEDETKDTQESKRLQLLHIKNSMSDCDKVENLDTSSMEEMQFAGSTDRPILVVKGKSLYDENAVCQVFIEGESILKPRTILEGFLCYFFIILCLRLQIWG
uniref:(California timema) hypothetical protein n=1 Tax=Timema californicum TaxID=61474 RepID=A0A7R9JFJ4_TIMCA|nr:unnamed protein product [Timema californicum]